MDITVKYSAWSNISYNGTQTFKFDDDEWAEASPEARRDMVNDEWEEWIRGDVSYDVIGEDQLKMEMPGETMAAIDQFLDDPSTGATRERKRK